MLSNTAVPRYYAEFRNAVLHGDIPINREIGMEMNRIDDLIANPGVYYDDMAVEGWIRFCENELTLTDGSEMHLLDSFKLSSRCSGGTTSWRGAFTSLTRTDMVEDMSQRR